MKGKAKFPDVGYYILSVTVRSLVDEVSMMNNTHMVFKIKETTK